MSVKISQLPSASEVFGSDVAPSVQYGTTKKFSMTTLANYLLNTFNSLSLGGTARTVKSAIDAIYTSLSSLLAKVGNVTMGTTATTITGAIAEHEGDITTINASLSNNLNNLYTRDVLRGRTYTQSRQQDTALLFVGKSGANAVVAVIGRNGGTPFCTFLSGNSTFLTVSDSNGHLSFTTGTYTDGRIYSTYRTDETYE